MTRCTILASGETFMAYLLLTVSFRPHATKGAAAPESEISSILKTYSAVLLYQCFSTALAVHDTQESTEIRSESARHGTLLFTTSSISRLERGKWNGTSRFRWR